MVLRSSNGTLFRIHSLILMMASPIFRDMFAASHESGEHIPLSEDEETTAGLLTAISPDKGLPNLSSIDSVLRIVIAAQKYAMWGTVSMIKLLFQSRNYLIEDPIRVFTLARHLGWDDVAKTAATRTLHFELNLLDPTLATSLQNLAATDFLMLLSLRQSRKEQLRIELEKNDWGVQIRNPSFCRTLGRSSKEWKALKDYIITEMERRPLGDTLTGAEFIFCPHAEACWTLQELDDQGKQRYAFDRKTVSCRLQRFIETLPKTISLQSR